MMKKIRKNIFLIRNQTFPREECSHIASALCLCGSKDVDAGCDHDSIRYYDRAKRQEDQITRTRAL